MNKKIVFSILAIIIFVIGISIYNYGRNEQWWGMSDRTRVLYSSEFLPEKLAGFERVKHECAPPAGFMELDSLPSCGGQYDAGNLPAEEARDRILAALEDSPTIYRTHSEADRALNDTGERAVLIGVKDYETKSNHLEDAILAEVFVSVDEETGKTLAYIHVEYLEIYIRANTPLLEPVTKDGIYMYDPIKNQYYLPSNGRYFIEDPHTEDFMYVDTGQPVI